MINYDSLKKEQLKISKKISIVDRIKKIRTIAGADQIHSENKIYSTMVVCDFKTMEVLDNKYYSIDSKLQYKSGFLFYREGPAVLETFNKLEIKPDVLLVLGNGILHPMRLGIASHVGILLDIATIGIAKNISLGEINNGTIYFDKEARGYELFTRTHAKPIYVSPGHKISLKSSLEITKEALRAPHKLPEPLHIAHKYNKKNKLF